MASPVADLGQSHQHHLDSAADSAIHEARKWIQAVTGRCFGERDFRGGLDNGILLCELLSSIKPGSVKKINRLHTPIASQDNLSAFLRGCEELGLKGSQLFDPGDLQDTPTLPAERGSDCSRKLKNVLITIYWLGRAANCCTSYNGPTLDLAEFEGLLSQMRKEAEEADSPGRSIRDSGYIDSWDSERSDSLSPPAHGREDSLDSLDSLGSRSRHTPSPDALGPRANSDGRGSDSESDGPFHRKMPDVRKDDMLARRTSVSEHKTAMPFNQYLPNKSNQSGYVPMPLRKKRSDSTEGSRKSWSTATSPVGGDRPLRFSCTDIVSDEPQSVSMIDMREGDDPLLQPHSQERHELMHNQYNRMKEDESHWQDDLARWKSRRRSISQDLIKKEEERKMMEQLLTGETVISQRRRSVKTYREIVEDKERREEELRIAYKNARTQEEASTILQRYAQRFSISEAILERLQLPKLLDRSVSADPTCPFPLSISLSPTSDNPPDVDPNGPLRFLRQQSAPSPKFTSTLEARVEEYPKDLPHKPQIRSRSSEPPSSRALSPKPVPLLTPKPYFHTRSSTDTWGSKVDGLLRVNGDLGSDGLPSTPDSSLGLDSPVFQPCTPTSSCTPSTSPAPVFTPASPLTPMSPLTPSPVPTDDQEVPNNKPHVLQEETNEDTLQLSRPCSLPTELHRPQESPRSTNKLLTSSQRAPQSDAKTEHKPEHDSVESSSQPKLQSEITTSQVMLQTSVSLCEETNRESVPTSLSAPGSMGDHLTADSMTEEMEKDRSGDVSVTTSQGRRADRWSWDQDEERKRQERWQQEQERMLQEKYQRELEKLKQEWEQAQREVAEEERKYHEEEQKILEETVAPLTPLSSVQPSPSRADTSSFSTPQDSIVRSLADWERKQEMLEKQATPQKGNSDDWRRRENDRTSDISTADDSMKTARSSFSQSTSQADTFGHSLQNGQKPPVPAKVSTAISKAPGPASESGRQSRRSGPLDNNKGSGSSSKPAAPSHHHRHPAPPDTPPPAPNRSVSGKKLCSSCGQPLGKGAAMIIETLSLYFHIHCFKCGVCKGQLGDTTTGTDVRIRNGLLNCHQCYIRSRSAGQPTML